MSITAADLRNGTHASEHVERPYRHVPASELADILEAKWGVEPFNEEIVAELLTRALEAENQLPRS
jgi:hypothetical protein